MSSGTLVHDVNPATLRVMHNWQRRVVDVSRPAEVDAKIADPDGWYIKPGDDGGTLFVSPQIARQLEDAEALTSKCPEEWKK